MRRAPTVTTRILDEVGAQNPLKQARELVDQVSGLATSLERAALIAGNALGGLAKPYLPIQGFIHERVLQESGIPLDPPERPGLSDAERADIVGALHLSAVVQRLADAIAARVNELHRLIAELADAATSTLAQRRKGGAAPKSGDRHAKWLDLATEIWQVEPGMSQVDVAKRIKANPQSGAGTVTVNTVRRIIAPLWPGGLERTRKTRGG